MHLSLLSAMKRNKMKLLLLHLLLILVLNSCIVNDIPYPQIQLFITELNVRGAVSAAQIDNETKTVVVNLADSVNPRRVYVESMKITDQARSTLTNDTTIDLTNPYSVTLSLYQDYYWTIKANQIIDRRFSIKNQVGEPTFDVKNKTATVNIAKGSDLNKIELLELKLGPEGSTINMSTSLPQLTWTNYDNNFATSTVVVNYRDFIVMEEWKLYVFISNSNVTTLRADAFVEAAYLYGEGIEGAEYGFEYKEATAETWIQVDKASIRTNGNNFFAKISKLKSNTSYVCRAIAGNEKGGEVNFTTGSTVELTNGSFDNWHKVGNVWNPWAENALSFWDTGNKGSTTMPGAESNSMPTTDTATGSGQAAKLESKFVGIGTLGKFAAGNMFVGEFKRVDGTNGVLDFGRVFTEKPTSLSGSYKYTSKPINYFDKAMFSHLSGVPDTCSIFIALGDWDSPLEIRTKPSDRKVFDPKDPKIIAYAEFFSGTSTDTYQPFTLNLDYRETNRTPKYIIIVCSASRYGDYFTGGAGSTLWIDNFVFGWD